MTALDQDIEFVECQSCGNIGIGSGEITCCERRMEPIDDTDLVIEEPTLEHLLRSIFDISETELDICLCVMEAGNTTVADLAEQIGYDRSIISRHLNHLAELGVLEKHRRLLKKGGHVYVYVPADIEAIRRSFRLQFLTWFRQAFALIDELNREKVELILETGSNDSDWKIFREE